MLLDSYRLLLCLWSKLMTLLLWTWPSNSKRYRVHMIGSRIHRQYQLPITNLTNPNPFSDMTEHLRAALVNPFLYKLSYIFLHTIECYLAVSTYSWMLSSYPYFQCLTGFSQHKPSCAMIRSITSMGVISCESESGAKDPPSAEANFE